MSIQNPTNNYNRYLFKILPMNLIHSYLLKKDNLKKLTFKN